MHVKHGVPDAIITGDFMIFKAYDLLADHAENLSPSQLQMLLKIVGETGQKCCHGQSLDMELARERRYASMSEYLRMIELKTGSLIEGAVQSGAVLGESSPDQRATVARMGRQLGMAFQIIDDSLDLVGAHANKSVKNDLKQAKATPMLIHALAKAHEAEKARILGAIGNSRLSVGAAAEIVDIYRRCGAIQTAQQLSRNYVDQARSALPSLPDTSARDRFRDILDVLGYWGMLSD